MSIKLATFDVAGTLVRSHWDPGALAVECAAERGVSLDPQVASETYRRLLGSRMEEYWSINRTKDHAACDRFWEELTADWLRALGSGDEAAPTILAAAQAKLYGSSPTVFTLYEDAIPGLQAVQSMGIRMVAISNWDYSLHRVLKSLGLAGFFELVVASREEAVPEKPEPALFEMVLAKTGARPSDAVHIGDDPCDDLMGARNAGLHAVLVDRTRDKASPPFIPSLLHIEEALAWTS
jgi:putative hydrolase of the HAD superfamily